MPVTRIPQTPTPADIVCRAMAEHEQALVGYALGIVRDLETARDVVQDTFVKLYEQTPDRVDGPGLKAWLFTVCRNRSLDMLRRRKRLVSLEEESVEEPVCHDPLPDETSARDDQASEVLRFLKRLPANQAEVLRLKFQNDLSYKEISAVTGLSVTNVGFLIHTAIRRLRQLLSHETAEVR